MGQGRRGVRQVRVLAVAWCSRNWCGAVSPEARGRGAAQEGQTHPEEGREDSPSPSGHRRMAPHPTHSTAITFQKRQGLTPSLAITQADPLNDDFITQ